jgi:hypothetical protein
MNQRPDALLEELCQGWAQQSGTRVSVPTMHRALERLGSRRKKSLLYASEPDSLAVLSKRH